MIIYVFTNKINGKQYVGQTVRTFEERFGEHKRKKSIFNSALKKHGESNFDYTTVDSAETIEELNRKEVEWIQKLGCVEPFGYNLCYGGNNTMGFNHKPESRLKMSVTKKAIGSAKGKRNHFYGKKHSDETRKKMREAWKTKRVMTDEMKQKIRESHVTKSVINLTTGETFESIKKASEHYGIEATHITRVCRGKRKSCGGYKWAYVEPNDKTIPSQAHENEKV